MPPATAAPRAPILAIWPAELALEMGGRPVVVVLEPLVWLAARAEAAKAATRTLYCIVKSTRRVVWSFLSRYNESVIKRDGA